MGYVLQDRFFQECIKRIKRLRTQIGRVATPSTVTFTFTDSSSKNRAGDQFDYHFTFKTSYYDLAQKEEKFLITLEDDQLLEKDEHSFDYREALYDWLVDFFKNPSSPTQYIFKKIGVGSIEMKWKTDLISGRPLPSLQKQRR